MPPTNDPFADVLRELRETRKALDHGSKVNDRLAQAIGNWSDETDLREREFLDTMRRQSVEAADRERRWTEQLAEVRTALQLLDRGQQDVKGEVKELREDTNEHDLAEIRAAAAVAESLKRKRQRTPTESDPPPGRIGALGYLVKQWDRSKPWSKVGLIVILLILWAFGGHRVFRWIDAVTGHTSVEESRPHRESP